MADDPSADALKARIIRAKLGTPSEPASPPPSFVQGVGAGLADKFYGAAQLGAHSADVPLMSPEMPIVPAGQTPSPDYAKSVDTQVQEREQQLQREGYGRGAASAGRTVGGIAGDVAITAPLGLGGAGARSLLGGIAQGLGMGAAGGAVSAATDPVTSGDFEKGKAKQLAVGAGTGAALGGALGGLGGALSRNDPEAAAELIRGKYYKGIKPGTTMTAGQERVYSGQVRDAVDAIIDNSGGRQLPRSPAEFSAAVDETKKALYGQYTALAKSAEDAGARVPLQPAADKLKAIVADELRDPAARHEAQRLLDLIPGGNARVTPTTAEDWLEKLNRRATGFKDNDPTGTGGALREVGGALRDSLTDAVEAAGFKDYRTLRRTYGSLSEIEDHVGQAAKLQRNRGAPGLGITDVGAGGLAVAGEPASALAITGLKHVSEWLKAPNRAVSALFNEAQRQRNAVPDGLRDVRDRIGQMIQRGTPAAGAAAGEAAQRVLP